jgi:CBS domain-containing membrane protein
MHTTRVRDIMTSVVEILQLGDTLDLASRLMSAGRIRHLPVVDGEQRLVGLVTHRKIASAWISHGDPANERWRDVARDIPVEMLMETDVVTIRPDASAAEVADLMVHRRIGCVPVLAEGKVVGIVTEADFVKLARKIFEREKARTEPARR